MRERGGRMQWPSSAPRPRIRRAQGSLESSSRGEYSALNMARPTQRAGAFRTRPPSHKRPIGACQDKANLSRPPVGISGPGHRKPLTTGQRPDIGVTLMLSVPHSHRPASSRFHVLFPAKHSPATDQGRKKKQKSVWPPCSFELKSPPRTLIIVFEDTKSSQFLRLAVVPKFLRRKAT